ncbi:ATP-dependent DNA helicase DDX11 isoform X2 [Carica papaya]|nr:ATP-dependent DNA helicase DDX11 isoform X2 [Carica papaya]
MTDESDKVIGNDNQIGSDDEPDWMKNFVINKDDQALERKIKKEKFKFGLKKHEKQQNRESFRVLFSRDLEEEELHAKKESEDLQNRNDEEELTDEFLLEEYESEEEGALSGGKSKRKAGGVSVGSSSDEEEEENGSDEEKEGLKVYFCSRTHSQLSQFIMELRKTSFTNAIKVVCLGSRKNLCINKDVLRLGNTIHINERCFELQKKKKNAISKIRNVDAEGTIRQSKASCGCPMLRKHKLHRQFKNKISQQGAMDIEDLVSLGRNIGTCPYYGSRSIFPVADLVVLPYQSLLSKSSRESLGLDLKNNIVIIDEAHNLADSLTRMYDAKVTLSQLENVHHNIEKYFRRFRSLLGPGNRRYIQTFMFLTKAFLQVLLNNNDADYLNTCRETEKTLGVKPTSDFSMAINDFLFSLNIDNINFFKLLEYIRESNIIHKVCGYGDKMASLQKELMVDADGKSSEEASTLSSFRAFVDFLLSLTNNDGDGRIIISRARLMASEKQAGSLKYVMLTGQKIFSEIVDQAHAVILAGGTLQPIEETRERLFPWLPSNQVQFFSCGHIIPPDSIMPVAVSQGPSGRCFDFSYSSRNSSTMIEELGRLICNLVTVVPEGIVVFFSSFEYEDQVYEGWKNSGILARMSKKKCVFREPRRSKDVESVLTKYKEKIDKICNGERGVVVQNGAILLAVVGGKISEGINFSDGMGRCIVMVGLPYPNPADIELLERIKHIEGIGYSNSTELLVTDDYHSGDVHDGFSLLRRCRRRGKEYYENLCMKAVNQSIGRAIRHINDYAAILLVDSRYVQESSKRSFSHPVNKLPQWIKDRLVSAPMKYGEVHRLLSQFFLSKKSVVSQRVEK